MFNIKLGITSTTEKYAFSFDPYFIYSFLNNSSKCENGLKFNDSFDLQSRIGAKKMFYPLYLNCDSGFNEQEAKRALNYTTPYKIKNWYFANPVNVNFIKSLKQAISSGYPIIVGVELKPSFSPFDLNKNPIGIKKDGLWKPKPNEKPDGGHAMCVIGYDDVKYGGCFKLVNSWGNEFGENGYVYIKYKDFKDSVKEAFVMEIDNYQSATINTPNYQRFGFKDPRYKNHIYEGETTNNNIDGYGIYSIDHKYFLIGRFDNGIRNGLFVNLNQDTRKLTVYEYQNDVVVRKINGFATETQNKSLEDFTKYIKKINPIEEINTSEETPDFEIKINQ
jgi:hypothetical protein